MGDEFLFMDWLKTKLQQANGIDFGKLVIPFSLSSVFLNGTGRIVDGTVFKVFLIPTLYVDEHILIIGRFSAMRANISSPIATTTY